MSPTKRTDYHKVTDGQDDSQNTSSKPTKRKSVSLRKVVPAVKTVPQVQNVPSVDEAKEEALDNQAHVADAGNSFSLTKKRKSVALRKTVPKVKVVPQVQHVPSVEDDQREEGNAFRAHPGGQIGLSAGVAVGQPMGESATGDGDVLHVPGGEPTRVLGGTDDGGVSQGSGGALGGAPGGAPGSAPDEMPGGSEFPQTRQQRSHVSTANTVADLQSEGKLHRARGSNVGWIIATIVLLVVAASAFWFFWQEWIRYDDTQDIQGSWIVSATGAAISIDKENIRIANDAAYNYEMDTSAKSMSFSFLKLSGKARYRFGGDRESFAVVEGLETSMTQLIWEDFWYQVRVAWAQLTGGALPDPSVDFTPSDTVTVTLFVRHLPQKTA